MADEGDRRPSVAERMAALQAKNSGGSEPIIPPSYSQHTPRGSLGTPQKASGKDSGRSSSSSSLREPSSPQAKPRPERPPPPASPKISYAKTFESAWSAQLCGGALQHESWHLNPQWLLTPSAEAAEFTFVLNQAKQERMDAIGIWVMVADRPEGRKTKLVDGQLTAKSKFTHVRQQRLEATLVRRGDGLPYVLSVATYMPGVQGSFTLTITTNDPGPTVTPIAASDLPAGGGRGALPDANALGRAAAPAGAPNNPRSMAAAAFSSELTGGDGRRSPTTAPLAPRPRSPANASLAGGAGAGGRRSPMVAAPAAAPLPVSRPVTVVTEREWFAAAERPG